MQQETSKNRIGVQSPEVLHMKDGDGTTYFGADQEWYKCLWQRKAGCGPTVAATVSAYLAKTRPECAALCEYDTSAKDGFLLLMQDVWKFVTPNMHGSSVEIFTEGIVAYGQSKGVALICDVLDIPKKKEDRPSDEQVAAFFRQAFEGDLPIAFQNYSSGELKNLDDWHWVTLLSFNPGTLFAQMYDQGKHDDLDIPLYLRTATNAGKFVIVRPGT